MTPRHYALALLGVVLCALLTLPLVGWLLEHPLLIYGAWLLLGAWALRDGRGKRSLRRTWKKGRAR